MSNVMHPTSPPNVDETEALLTNHVQDRRTLSRSETVENAPSLRRSSVRSAAVAVERNTAFSPAYLEALVEAVEPMLVKFVMNEIAARLVRREPGHTREDGRPRDRFEHDVDGTVVPSRRADGECVR